MWSSEPWKCRSSPATISAALLATLVTLAATPGAAMSQRPDSITLEIIVSAVDGRPLEDAEVNLRELGITALTDSTGRLKLLRLPAGKMHIAVTLLGFRTETSVVHLRPGQVHVEQFSLEDQAIPVEGINVTVDDHSAQLDVLRGFYERRERGIGYFMTRAEIEESGTSDLTNLLHMVPGLRTSPSQFGQTRMRATRTPVTSQCRIKVYIDGMRYRNPSDVAGIPTGDIEALEVYRGRSELPAQFADLDTNCGAVVIWTRRHRP